MAINKIGNKEILKKFFGDKEIIKEVINGSTIYEKITSSPIYGVSGLYNSSPVLTRTDDAVSMSAVVNSSTGLVSSDFDDVFPYNEMVKTTIGTNEFVYVPSMWFRVGTDGDGNITDVAVSRQQGNIGNWYQTEAFYYGAYGASVYYDTQQLLYKLTSVSGVARPRNSTTIGDCRNKARNVGSGYFQRDLYHNTIMLFLWWIEFANKDSQSIMRGRDATYGTSMVDTGGTDSLSKPSGFNPSTGQMRWHYIEDFVGNICEFIDGIIVYDGTKYATADPTKFSDRVDELSQLSYTVSGTGSCIASFGWDNENPFLVSPKIVMEDASYATYFCDFGSTSSTPAKICYSGCPASESSSLYGLTCFGATNVNSSLSVGARLLYKPAA